MILHVPSCYSYYIRNSFLPSSSLMNLLILFLFKMVVIDITPNIDMYIKTMYSIYSITLEQRYKLQNINISGVISNFNTFYNMLDRDTKCIAYIESELMHGFISYKIIYEPICTCYIICTAYNPVYKESLLLLFNHIYKYKSLYLYVRTMDQIGISIYKNAIESIGYIVNVSIVDNIHSKIEAAK